MSSFNDRTSNQDIASPMTNLANSLGNSLTVRRRLTMSESSDTLKKCYDNVLYDNRNSSLGIENNRLFKGSSKNINDGPSFKCLMLQKIINSPVEKENSSNCVDMIVSKTILSPTQSSPTFLMHSRHTRGRLPLEDQDPNSQDSGFFSVPSDDSRSLNRLIDSQSGSEKKKLSLNNPRPDSCVYPTTVPDVDDAFLDNAVSPARLSQDSLPSGFDTLIDGDIFSQNSPIIKPIVRRRYARYSSDTLQKDDSAVFEDIKNIESGLKKRKLINEFEYTFKTPVKSKKSKPNIDLSMSFDSPRINTSNISLTAPASQRKTTLFDYGFCKKNTFRRSFSTSEATIKAAFEKEDNGSNLIGDFSQSFILPLLSFGRHADLRSISSDTLAQLLEGTYDDFIDSYLIIDCRYPYEYEGGHIKNAINIFTKEQLLKDYTEDKLGKKSPKTDHVKEKRNVLIFHCEFSSERGPSLSRYLRNADRQKNSMCYPYLDYPEMYLLDGGYCKFFSQYSRLCVPSKYRSMYDPDHTKDLRMFRSKSKTWSSNNTDGTSRMVNKNSLKRLGFN